MKPPRKKPTGQIGGWVLSSDNAPTFKPIEFSSNKEEIERKIFEYFFDYFNSNLPFGDDNKIEGYVQQGTNDLDYRIDCRFASYLELTEFKPERQSFSDDLKNYGKRRLWVLAEYIHKELINKKSKKYGALSNDVILVIYSTQQQYKLLGLEDVMESICFFKGCQFRAVFLLTPFSANFAHVSLVHPYQRTESRPYFPETPYYYLDKIVVSPPMKNADANSFTSYPGDAWPSDLGNGADPKDKPVD
jgi:predicted CopG family antitoxin